MKASLGFTLVELMITLVVAAILLAVGVPLFSGVLASNRAAAEVNSLVTTLRFARTEAVARGRAVSVCPRKEGSTTECDTAWDNGWLVFVDLDRDGVIDSGSDSVIRVFDSDADDAIQYTSSSDSLTFNPTGERAGASSTIQLDVPEAPDYAKVRCVRINASGQIRMTKTACS